MKRFFCPSILILFFLLIQHTAFSEGQPISNQESEMPAESLAENNEPILNSSEEFAPIPSSTDFLASEIPMDFPEIENTEALEEKMTFPDSEEIKKTVRPPDSLVKPLDFKSVEEDFASKPKTDEMTHKLPFYKATLRLTATRSESNR